MPDGDLVLEVGIQNHGQGLETTLAQLTGGNAMRLLQL